MKRIQQRKNEKILTLTQTHKTPNHKKLKLAPPRIFTRKDVVEMVPKIKVLLPEDEAEEVLKRQMKQRQLNTQTKFLEIPKIEPDFDPNHALEPIKTTFQLLNEFRNVDITSLKSKIGVKLTDPNLFFRDFSPGRGVEFSKDRDLQVVTRPKPGKKEREKQLKELENLADKIIGKM